MADKRMQDAATPPTPAKGGPAGDAPTRLTVPVSGDDWCQSMDEGAITLLMYGDYQCPDSGAAHLVVRELLRDLREEVRLVFRHFPLDHEHEHARHAAEMAEAAGAQGRFWPMHDLLYLRQDRLDDEHLVQYAVSVGCGEDAVRRDLETHAHAAKVDEDVKSGQASGVDSTPTFFIDGERFTGTPDVATLGAALREKLAGKAR